jgi:hypothetical protein
MMFVTLFLAVIGKIIAWIAGTKNLAFSDVIRLACVSITPAFIIAFFAHLGIGIGFLIALGYLIFAVTVNRNTPLTNE